MLESPHRSGIKLLRVGQHALFGLQRLILAAHKPRRFDFLVLVAPQVHHPQPVLLTLDHRIQFFGSRAPTPVRLAHGFRRKPPKAIQQNPLLRLVKAGQRLALGMDKRQLRRQLLEHSHGRRLVVHKHPPLARGQNLPPQNNLVPIRVDAVLFQDRLRPRCGLEHARDDGFVSPVAHHFHRCFAPHQQGQRIHKDRLARTGLTRQQIQPWAEHGNGVIDDGVVFSAQFDKHSLRTSWNLLGTRSIAGTIRAQHSMNGASPGPTTNAPSLREHPIDNLEGANPSDTVDIEVNADS